MQPEAENGGRLTAQDPLAKADRNKAGRSHKLNFRRRKNRPPGPIT